jgi:hypothetical protein
LSVRVADDKRRQIEIIWRGARTTLSQSMKERARNLRTIVRAKTNTLARREKRYRTPPGLRSRAAWACRMVACRRRRTIARHDVAALRAPGAKAPRSHARIPAKDP